MLLATVFVLKYFQNIIAWCVNWFGFEDQSFDQVLLLNIAFVLILNIYIELFETVLLHYTIGNIVRELNHWEIDEGFELEFKNELNILKMVLMNG